MIKLPSDRLAEIEEQRSTLTSTRRSTSAGLEEILYKPIEVLDHGFVRVVDYMGGDEAVVQAARVSYGRGTKRVNEDRGLINYLLRHWHTTPFEMAEIKLHVKLPIFVARQWIRHRMASVNEYSARYSVLDREFYLPDPSMLAAQSSKNRQGRGDVLNEEEGAAVLRLLQQDASRAYDDYLEMLNETEIGEVKDQQRSGLARELARMNLSLNFYTQWYWKIDLHNLMSFLRLRADSHAQYEIRAYAEVILDILKRWVPLTHEAFLEHRLGAVQLSAKATQVLREILAGRNPSLETSGLSRREWEELLVTFDLAGKNGFE